jgi:hypothetical protein
MPLVDADLDTDAENEAREEPDIPVYSDTLLLTDALELELSQVAEIHTTSTSKSTISTLGISNHPALQLPNCSI